ncbi:flagellar biosynthetic protein FliP [Clostridium acetobutylicum]|uniref:Flagellar biosynthetic protein FliP n=1 Tax=Clostridium acetobutylicum (strain ATCC 824 / DSM 792 / JCM 1419 / IAM 19013 / LMG 5710 / NBRC 13948 / NRRL B-527 / VKM B-1787 / 2291 / W) TaxID=272562 RepID=Q97H63_CLOAB|nr:MULTISPECIES: flagellar type III secretion system pore protein FliP [Clostridium]AAK80108.1 Flagellar biosynthesis protein FliP [Clostridium acetobutylicum ATCC 824]ADZ21201.1 flagellar biosynthesis protein FliP [Clostridium acetobutylicum EA 2018]AEI34251.1 flagellar biosynthesis protein FliP [Clostridium acetobutylicum DSM 1731]AWV79467.1 flagellar biosynthetic protein FliP [Clostridium acetobutylicum]MBC2394562.1 flagellar type III secretion system pore protein FliP [Clostridium acetobut
MKKKSFIMLAVFLVFLAFLGARAHAAPVDTASTIQIPKVNISVDNANSNNPKDFVDNIKLLLVLTVITLLPSIIMMMTSFTRIIVVLGFLRTSMGTQQSPPNQVLIGLALFLTMFIMMPTYKQINKNAIQPYLNKSISQQQALLEMEKPLRTFMYKQTYQKDLKLFIDLDNQSGKITKDTVPFHDIVPAFIISELKTAFTIGFLLYIPFLIIDLVVASILMSMGMMMLPPVMVSMPFKLLLFIMVDGWYLIVKSLVLSFGG